MNQKPKIKKVGGSKKIVILPEELTGKQLTTWVRKKKIPLLRRKMRCTINTEGERILAGIRRKNRKLTFVRRYLKSNPPMRRTKWSYKQMRRTKWKKQQQ